MSVAIRTVTFDCTDALALARFWATLTGWHVFHDDDPEVLVAPYYPYDGTGLLFIPVPEGKSAKNRLHLDLKPTDLTRDEQVEQALRAGATVVDDRREPSGAGWVVLADPEGNELCILRSDAEREPAPQAFRLG